MLVVVVAVCFSVVPFHASAQSLNIMNVCGGDAPNCDFADFMDLVRRIMNFIILLSIPLATIAFAYAGYLFLTSLVFFGCSFLDVSPPADSFF
jgi:hypothetical protein